MTIVIYSIIYMSHEPIDKLAKSQTRQRSSISVAEVPFGRESCRGAGGSVWDFDPASLSVRETSRSHFQAPSCSWAEIHIHRKAVRRFDPVDPPASEIHRAVDKRCGHSSLRAVSQKAKWWVRRRKRTNPFNWSTFLIGLRIEELYRCTAF